MTASTLNEWMQKLWLQMDTVRDAMAIIGDVGPENVVLARQCRLPAHTDCAKLGPPDVRQSRGIVLRRQMSALWRPGVTGFVVGGNVCHQGRRVGSRKRKTCTGVIRRPLPWR